MIEMQDINKAFDRVKDNEGKYRFIDIPKHGDKKEFARKIFEKLDWVYWIYRKTILQEKISSTN